MAIFTDQVGYFTNSNKIAFSTKPCNYQVIRVLDSKCVLDGVTFEGLSDKASGDTVYSIDFSELKAPGEYYILSGSRERSCDFKIGDDIYKQLFTDAQKCLYYQRCGMELTPEYAGEYVHAPCHLEPAIMLEDYLNKTEHPYEYDMCGGWHDAGDYGRYVSAGAVALGHVLHAFELFPDAFSDSLNIPESGNGIPDILNECYYELSWMLKMQDSDGGVHHKLTAYKHPGFIMPEDDHDQFLIFPVSSMSTADFVAVMALASRIYKPYMPEFSETALDAARLGSWWLSEHEFTFEKNPDGCNTGEYDDNNDIDERLWAAAEMLITDTDNRKKYLKLLNTLTSQCRGKVDFGWTDVSGFASLCILTDSEDNASSLRSHYKDAVIREADRLLTLIDRSGYALAMENDDFVWGSNMVVCNRAMLLSLAEMVSDDEDKKAGYHNGILSHIHYLLGRNPMDTSYVTGHGQKAFKYPHARVTDQDGIDAPMPGWVSGGPFMSPCDPPAKASIPEGTPPMKCYIDHVGSYSTNEITIYWNTPLIYLLAYLEA